MGSHYITYRKTAHGIPLCHIQKTAHRIPLCHRKTAHGIPLYHIQEDCTWDPTVSHSERLHTGSHCITYRKTAHRISLYHKLSSALNTSPQFHHNSRHCISALPSHSDSQIMYTDLAQSLVLNTVCTIGIILIYEHKKRKTQT